MRVGVAKEIKSREYRVALTPAGALELAARGHEVIVETGAGDGSGFPDVAYEAVPPGTPAAALRPLLRFFGPQRRSLGDANPWSATSCGRATR